ncbi:MAG TPA: Ig-like domain-containing protein, partial [Terriglobales bacterium]|nr:Ig-like domain-containing protein [Terriglobales bacterium]
RVFSNYGAIPNGEMVTFYDGKTVLATVALAAGTAAYTTSSLSVKRHSIRAVYPGDNSFTPIKKSIPQVVQSP